ncbi:hypothetical protein JYU34_001269 [Plutella xylostella]|uniref:Uncharacterized protein n=1 Tax=Plutella xylostella TaxID=51655 RepID=A0ABQ7R6M0_PLUXY|nr:hypothetical protein JYU34_001269 [Plutella xylostella]
MWYWNRVTRCRPRIDPVYENYRFYYQQDLSEICCAPYYQCAKLWDCLVGICSGANQFLIHVLMVNYAMCKCEKWLRPNPFYFSYYIFTYINWFIVFGCAICFWHYYGERFYYKYYKPYYNQFIYSLTINQFTNEMGEQKLPWMSTPDERFSFGKKKHKRSAQVFTFCFNKSYVIGSALGNGGGNSQSSWSISLLTLVVNYWLYGDFDGFEL